MHPVKTTQVCGGAGHCDEPASPLCLPTGATAPCDCLRTSRLYLLTAACAHRATSATSRRLIKSTIPNVTDCASRKGGK